MQSKASTVAEYLESLPEDRREALEAVRKVVLENLDDDVEERMQYGMIGWSIPHRVFPDGYHADPEQPLPYAAIASQKNYLSLYLMTVYSAGGEDEKWFREEWSKSGKKLDMGKSCIRFRSADDLALDVIAGALRRTPPKKHIETYRKHRPPPKKAKKD